jgi:hypothetical protein
LIDGLLLPARIFQRSRRVVAYDGDESFTLEAIEAMYYEVVRASREEWLAVEQGHYRLLRQAGDFSWEEPSSPAKS